MRLVPERRQVWAAAAALVLAGTVWGGDYKVGFGRRQITPPLPIPLAGFANRAKLGDTPGTDIWTKALAMEDGTGQKLVIVTADLVTMPKAMFDMVAGRIMYRNGLDRAHVVINLSHTHSGPTLGWKEGTDREMMLRIETYRNKVLDAMADVASDAVADLKPATISYGAGQVEFPHNRRQHQPDGAWVFGVNPDGPVDRTVPVLKVTGADGKVRGALFGLSCHPSVLTYDFTVLSGDYAGIAQAAWEKAQPGATALFMQLCGGDQNAAPRRKLELVEKYGQELAAEVSRVMSTPMKTVHGPMKAAMVTTELPFAPFSLEEFEKNAKSPDALTRKHAESMLKAYRGGHPPLPALPYMMQAYQFGKELTLLTMNDEVVVDYCLRVKKEFGAAGMIVAGYSNERACYIASARVLKEGGYEARDSMLMNDMPGPFSDKTEEIIFEGIRKLMRAVGRPPVH